MDAASDLGSIDQVHRADVEVVEQRPLGGGVSVDRRAFGELIGPHPEGRLS